LLELKHHSPLSQSASLPQNTVPQKLQTIRNHYNQENKDGEKFCFRNWETKWENVVVVFVSTFDDYSLNSKRKTTAFSPSSSSSSSSETVPRGCETGGGEKDSETQTTTIPKKTSPVKQIEGVDFAGMVLMSNQKILSQYYGSPLNNLGLLLQDVKADFQSLSRAVSFSMEEEGPQTTIISLQPSLPK